MVTADFITKRHFVAYEVSMSSEPACEPAQQEKVLVASSATDLPTDMNNGKNKRRRGRVPSFINPLTGRPTTLSLAVIVFAVVFIFYWMSRTKDASSSVDERDKNPKFHHILAPVDDPVSGGLNAAGGDLNLMHRSNIKFYAGDDKGGDLDKQAAPKFPPPGLKIQLHGPDAKGKKQDLPPQPEPKEFPVEVMQKPDLRCPDDEKPYILFLVVSLPSEVLARTAVRRTWADPKKISEASGLSLSWRTVFVTGRTEGKDDQIDREARTYGDILQGDFPDLSTEVTRKVMLGFQWAERDIPRSCRPVYVFKTNIRVYINLPLIIPWIRDKLGAVSSGLYVGKLLREDRPIRDKQDPLYVPYQDYSGNVFPNLARGPLYMLSMDVVQSMVPKFEQITPIAMEDAYVGLLAHHLGVQIKDDDHFVLIKRPKNFCHYRNMMFIFDIEPTEVMHVFNVVEQKHRYAECTDREF